MAMFGGMKKLAGVALLALLSIGNAWGGEFQDAVETAFSPSVIASVKETGTNGEVTLKAPERMPDYFDSGDKAYKVFAIDSARIFVAAAGLERLTLRLPRAGQMYAMDISRADAEKYYGVNFSEMSGNRDAWRNDFAAKYDNKVSRSAFVEKFVVAE